MKMFDTPNPEPPLVEQPREAPPATHPTRSTYDREVGEVKDNVLRMGALVEAQIRKAIAALVAHDAEAAFQVILDDRQINEVQRKATAMIAAVIATQQPVARDLRYLLTLDHVSYELERMGDHAGSVAKQARKLAPHPPLREFVLLPQLGERVAELVKGIILALVDIDANRAREVARLDDEVDDLYHRIFDEVLVLMRDDPANVDPGTRILFAAHYLERIGDRVTNIAEDIVFLVSGEVEDLNP
ncbi:MAG TPA: phosphate signaling complex protein PhoU [Candidatus Limnocylindrales bacterium]|nr:phosphate signaling complex protein PhoU [Candidatus Limnocylindrales bacterium]